MGIHAGPYIMGIDLGDVLDADADLEAPLYLFMFPWILMHSLFQYLPHLYTWSTMSCDSHMILVISHTCSLDYTGYT